jgi:hypothetical protein
MTRYSTTLFFIPGQNIISSKLLQYFDNLGDLNKVSYVLNIVSKFSIMCCLEHKFNPLPVHRGIHQI